MTTQAPEKKLTRKNQTLPDESLEQRLGHPFARPELLAQALTHSSLRYERQMAAAASAKASAQAAPTQAEIKNDPTLKDNERLEFLGDAIVGMLVAESLYRRYPDLREGDLTRLRAALVSRKYLGEVGQKLRLGRWLRVGKGEERSGGRNRAVLLANCVEALTAAIYLDSGSIETTAAFVERVIVAPEAKTLHHKLRANQAIGDYKSALQELLQARGRNQPTYTLLNQSGPDHNKHFVVTVHTDPDGAVAEGSGSTKKKAEQQAAQRALTLLKAEESEQ